MIKSAEWTLSHDTGEGVPRAIYSAECLNCGRQSAAVDNESLPVEVWALKHTGLNPQHREFKLTTELFWRVDPAPGNPYRELNQPET
ncbi:hypothetical protein [Streptomyces aidingensis]|uniref:DUF7848 domain-containing protein n=1 Tax=Streptomyces aidingensis TaxID=910347 RepID=UPI0011148463|nr:hypothetical protein [Streptomyces aidingensis]